MVSPFVANRVHHGLRRVKGLIGPLICLLTGLTRAMAQDQPDAKLLDFHGRVQWLHDRANDEVTQTNLSLHAGQEIHTLEDSMAVVWFRNNNCCAKLGESTHLRIGQPNADSTPVMRLLLGALYFFSRERTR